MICVVDLVDLSRATLSVMKAGMDLVVSETERTEGKKRKRKMIPMLEGSHSL